MNKTKIKTRSSQVEKKPMMPKCHFYQNILVHLLLKIKISEHEVQEAAL